MKNKAGKVNTRVFLVGAGPGDPELLTIKAVNILDRADVVIYDSLVSPDILRTIKKAEKIPAGKRKQKHSVSQEEINTLILENVKKGGIVARLKGGDPLIFGRAGEEMDFLDKHGIKYEIIPGISAAQAAASSLKIPLTERGKSSSVIFCTGHPLKNACIPAAGYRGTAVYYMAATVSGEIARKLLEKGWDKNTPAAVVSKISLRGRKVLRTGIGRLSKRKKVFESPALVIVGAAAGRRIQGRKT